MTAYFKFIEIINTGDGLGTAHGLVGGREQKGAQDGNDRNHHQQFNQGERTG